MDPKNIDYEKLHKILYEFKFSLSQMKPIYYIALKPYIQEKIDINVAALNDRASLTYEAYLSDEVLEFIAQKADHNTSYKIYNSIIIDNYKDKLYSNLPKNHPIKISNKMFKYFLLLSLIGIFIFLISNKITEKTLSNSFIALIVSYIFAVVAKKIYLFKRFSSL
jgi:hypothetical protein